MISTGASDERTPCAGVQLVTRIDLAGVLRRSATPTDATPDARPPLPEDALQWSWPPYAPVEAAEESFDTAEWAPSSVVWHPQLRVGRWTVLYRRAA